MPSPSLNLTMRAARQMQHVAKQLLAVHAAVEHIVAARDFGAVQFDQLSPDQLEQLGLIDYTALNKLADEVINAGGLRQYAFDAGGIAL